MRNSTLSLLAFAIFGCGSPATLPRETLLDPQTCGSCHPDAFTEWSGSMHAYASTDPVFLAMNKRGQRETNGALGDFCVKCHAPMAVNEKATTDGLNLAQVPAPLQGVTCFFCHSVQSVTDTHDNPLVLATDLKMRGEISDPVQNTAHQSVYSPLHDRDRAESATMCGACHDVVSPAGGQIERTFAEWKGSVFSASGGATCGQCHMDQSPMDRQIAVGNGLPNRRFHSHMQVGVDLALTDGFPGTGPQREKAQSLIDSALQSALCVKPLGNQTSLSAILDNVAAGHQWPSGASQDRRLWAEVVAYGTDGGVLYQSGVVPDGGVVTQADSDVWVMRECMLDAQQNPVEMFWQAQAYESNALPVLATFDQADPRFYQTHYQRNWPLTGKLSDVPARVTLQMKLQPVGLEVIDSLISSGDLDAAVRDRIPSFDVGSLVEWTPEKATLHYQDDDGLLVECVSDTALNVSAVTVKPPDNAHCKP